MILFQCRAAAIVPYDFFLILFLFSFDSVYFCCCQHICMYLIPIDIIIDNFSFDLAILKTNIM